MSRLADLIEGMSEADALAAELRLAAENDPTDPTLPINIEALSRRRSDLERQLAKALAQVQMDLVRYRVEQFDGSEAPAIGVAQSIVLFQTLLTAVFDAVRSGPKRSYQPSTENVRLSTLHFAAAPAGREAIHFIIANDRLLAMESDLDVAFDLMFELFGARAKTLIRDVAARAGIAAVSAAHAWAGNAVHHGLTTTVSWRKRNNERRSLALSHSEALLFRTSIEAVADDASQPLALECEILSLDEDARSFRLLLADKSVVTGQIGDGFPFGGRWTLRYWYVADLLRATRIHYATGEEVVRWSLRGLTPLD
jgi:hypothetical protein